MWGPLSGQGTASGSPNSPVQVTRDDSGGGGRRVSGLQVLMVVPDHLLLAQQARLGDQGRCGGTVTVLLRVAARVSGSRATSTDRSTFLNAGRCWITLSWRCR